MAAYWDACLFVDYLNQSDRGVEIIAPLLAETRERNDRIVTSIISRVEVAYAQIEKEERALQPRVEQAIDAMLTDRTLLDIVECNQLVVLAARALIREALPLSRSLASVDAIHIASAVWAGADVLYTFDDRLMRATNDLG